MQKSTHLILLVHVMWTWKILIEFYCLFDSYLNDKINIMKLNRCTGYHFLYKQLIRFLNVIGRPKRLI